jgi:RNA polymerase sigma-70 factor, ECF subfamily
MTTNNEELVKLALAGSQDAYRALYDGNLSQVRAMIAPILRSCPNEIEDIAQESMMRAFRHLQSFDGRCKFQTWICRIAVNAALEKYRARKSSALTYAAPIEYDQYGESTGFTAEDVERGYKRFEASSDLPLILAGIHFTLREALELRYLGEMSFHAISEELGITIEAAKSRAFRGLRLARQYADEMRA